MRQDNMVRQVHKHVANMMNEAKKLSRPPVSEPKNRSLPHMPVYLPNISRSTTSSNINNICLEYVIRERQLNQSLEKMMCPMSTITAQRKVRTTLPGINDRNDKIQQKNIQRFNLKLFLYESELIRKRKSTLNQLQHQRQSNTTHLPLKINDTGFHREKQQQLNRIVSNSLKVKQYNEWIEDQKHKEHSQNYDNQHYRSMRKLKRWRKHKQSIEANVETDSGLKTPDNYGPWATDTSLPHYLGETAIHFAKLLARQPK